MNGGVKPDPLTLVNMRNIGSNFKSDLNQMHTKQFMYKGDNENTPKALESHAKFLIANKSLDDQSGKTISDL